MLSIKNLGNYYHLFLLLFLLSSCGNKSYIESNPEYKKVFLSHVIEIDKKGRLQTYGFDQKEAINQLKESEKARKRIQQESQDSSSTSDQTNKKERRAMVQEQAKDVKYAAIKQGIDQHLSSGNKKIMVFIHGGLNSPKSSLKRAINQNKEILSDSIYPIFINWHSGVLSSYGQQLFNVSSGLYYKGLKVLASPLVLASHVLIGVGSLPIDLYNNFASNGILMGQYDADGSQWSRTRDNSVKLYETIKANHDSLRINAQWGADQRKFGKSFLIGTNSVIWAPTRLVIMPFYHAFGKPSWMNMKRRAHSLIHPPSEFDIRDYNDDNQRVSNLLNKGETGVIVDFIEEMKDIMEKDFAHRDYEVIIVGHSMGTIVLNDIITAYPNLRFDNIIYMGAACSIKDMTDAVFPYLDKHPESKFYNLMLHPVSESREQMAFGTELFVPRGSLLNHVDNMFEQVSDFTDRTAGKWENMIQSTQLIPMEVRDRVYYKSFIAKNNKRAIDKVKKEVIDENGKKKTEKVLPELHRDNIHLFQPQQHGQFDDGKYWLPEFWEIEGE